MRHAVSLALALLAGGCVGRVAPSGDMYRPAPERLSSEIGPGELGPPDATVDRALDGSPGDACAPNDAITTCDPLAASSSCGGGGACYLVKGQYLDCVCPPGTIDEGGACSTAVECRPRLTCFSSTGAPPGACRKLCDPQSDASCATGQSCTVIPNFSTLGYCQPSP